MRKKYSSVYLDLSGVVAVEDGGGVALEPEVVVEEGGAEERQVLELVQGHRLLHELPCLLEGTVSYPSIYAIILLCMHAIAYYAMSVLCQ